MKQKTPTLTLLIMLTVVLLAGCNKEPQKPQAVVIDMRAISAVAGIDEQIKEHMKIVNQQIFEEMTVLSNKFKKELEDKRASFGDSPSEDDEEKIQTRRTQLKKEYGQAQSAANARRMKERSEIRQSFIDGIMPIAQKIALEYGASIILKADEGVFWSDGSVDITDEVIGLMPGSNDPQPAGKEQKD